MGFIDIIKDILNISNIKQNNIELSNKIDQLNNKVKQLMNENKSLTNTNQQFINEYDKLKTIVKYNNEEKEVILQEIEQNKEEIKTLQFKNQHIKYAFDSMKKAIKSNSSEEDLRSIKIAETNLLSTEVELPLNCLNIKELRSLYNKNKKNIQNVLIKYEKQYTTKSNIALYQLMTIGLESSIQNILSTIKYNKLEQSLTSLKNIIDKYYNVICLGNQTIAPTMKKFLIEIESLYTENIKIEYEYYVQKERIKEEQKVLREQMKQETEERKQLEAEQKKVEKEEAKYNTEISNITKTISNTSDAKKLTELQTKLLELQRQLEDIQNKKSDIIKLQNGKAGYVYVISNLGSFGADIFKVGMTRRLEPMDRINELSNASVPFSFDVHSFIFSNDAVALEAQLHKELNAYRVNKVNLRKEFFKISIDKLEQLVQRINPTAEFNKTMLAEQYKQGLSVNTIPETLNDFEED